MGQSIVRLLRWPPAKRRSGREIDARGLVSQTASPLQGPASERQPDRALRFGPRRLTILLLSRSIMVLEFEWHEAKAQANLQVHGVSFELAKTVFKDPFAVERLDDREDYGEDRYVIIGMAEGHVLLYVAYTEREKRIRIISARRVTQHEQDDYFWQNA